MQVSGFHNLAFKGCGILLLLLCSVWQLWFSYQEQKGFLEKFDKTETQQTRNFRGLTLQAKQKHMLEADLATAKKMLQQALTVNPSYVPAWLSLAELCNDLGEKERAYEILQYVDQLTRGLKRWRWEKALTAYQLGNVEMLPGELSYIIYELSGKERNDALQLAFSLWDAPEELLDKLGLKNISHLLGHAIKNNHVRKALFFWEKIENEQVQWQQKDALALIDLLLREGEVRTASGIWRKHFNPDTIFFNGDFSTPFLGRAFGWRTGKKQNYDQLIEKSPDGNPSNVLHFRFKGWENINFADLYQIVPVEGGKEYTLTAEMKTHKMTTDQRPFLEVSGYKCKASMTHSEMVDADQDWTEHQVLVQVPEECAAMVVRLRRKQSDQIDSKLAGQLWLRNFQLSRQAKVTIGKMSQQ